MTTQQPNAFAAGLRKALDLVTERRDRAVRLSQVGNAAEYEGELYAFNNLIDTLSDQLLDAGGFLGAEPVEEKDVTIRGWQVFLEGADYGWFESEKDGTGGGLWFEDGALVDYDGVGCLPAAVVEGIRTLGRIVPADME